jgi:hypothetical protein
MSIWFWVILFAATYLGVGIGNALIQRQTPYQNNPLWAMILLWPFYWA